MLAQLRSESQQTDTQYNTHNTLQYAVEEEVEDSPGTLRNVEASQLDFEEFIDAVKGYPCLWNTSLRSYNELPKRKVAWLAISEKFGKDAKFCKELNAKLTSLDPEKSDEQIVEAIIQGCSGGYDEYDREFPFVLMEKIANTKLREENRILSNEDGFGKEKAKDKAKDGWVKYAENPEKDNGDFDKYKELTRFSLRHYTKAKTDPPSYDQVTSNFARLKQSLDKSRKKDEKEREDITGLLHNTKFSDYIDIGNAAFTFWLFCVDGKVPYRSFLKGSTHYVEIPLGKKDLMELKQNLNEIEFFASNDLISISYYLNTMKPTLLRGTLEDLAPLVLRKSKISLEDAKDKNKKTSKDILMAMEKLIAIEELLESDPAGEIHAEVKIPGTIDVKNGLKWKKKDTKDEIVLFPQQARCIITSDGKKCAGRSKTNSFRHVGKNSSNSDVNNNHMIGAKLELKGVLKQNIAHAGTSKQMLAYAGTSKQKIEHAGASEQ